MIQSLLSNAILTRGISYLLDLYLADNPVLRSFYTNMYRDFTPDINGYTLIFMQPPDLSGFHETSSAMDGSFKKLMESFIYLATDFTPPSTQIVPAQVTSRSGALSYASDVMSTEDISISFIEKAPLAIYNFHLLWIEYIREVLRGTIKPNDKYIDENVDLQYFGAIDYLGSFFIVKYLPDMKSISYIGKCIGVFPKSLPSKQLIGTRTTNEITILPFDYSCIAYREYIPNNPVSPNAIPENFQNKWIEKELEQEISNIFPTFGQSIKGVIDNVRNLF